eukprot:TCALIF_06241-PA protein Name:"Similar to EIF2AK1 Eukaryotic translation initiation factor 2-alpha kinase 1 (Macaca fascicularis)" AED:0.16 eAED:0.19 QI:0/0/0/0.66/0.8/0.83/6/0/705
MDPPATSSYRGKDAKPRPTKGFHRNGQPLVINEVHRNSSNSSSSMSDLFTSPQFNDPLDGSKDDVARAKPSHQALVRPQGPRTLAHANSLETEEDRRSLAFQIVLFHLCSFYEKPLERRERLFRELCHRLRIDMSAALYQYPELASLRSHYQHSFVRMVKSVQGQMDAHPTSTLPKSRSIQCINEVREQDLYHNSRYQNEFEELSFIAKGGFGVVFRARNKLDGCVYAVKKIVLRYCDPELFAKIFREVTTLAKLNHANVVSYKTAWLEPFVDCPRPRTRLHCQHPSLPNMTSEMWSSSSRTSLGLNGNTFEEDRILRRIEATSQSSGIVFNETEESQDVIDMGISTTRSAVVTHAGVSRLAATPPNRARLPPITDVAGTSPSSRFWIASDDEDEFSTTSFDGLDDNSPRKSRKTKLPTFPKPNGAEHSGAFQSNVQDRAVLYVQMQLCDRTLREWLDERNAVVDASGHCQIDAAINLHIFEQILRGVEYIHAQGIVHRDLKPRNIFLSRNNEVRPYFFVQIGDFGLAKHDLDNNISTPQTPVDSTNYSGNIFTTEKSHHTSGVGTQAYGAPEQLAFGIVNEKSDIYSVGIVLFELFHPFSTAMERSKAITQVRQDMVPEDLALKYPLVTKAIQSMLASVPSLRPRATEVLQTLFSAEAKKKQALEEQVQHLEDVVAEQKLAMHAKDELIRKLQAALAKMNTSTP